MYECLWCENNIFLVKWYFWICKQFQQYRFNHFYFLGYRYNLHSQITSEVQRKVHERKRNVSLVGQGIKYKSLFVNQSSLKPNTFRSLDDNGTTDINRHDAKDPMSVAVQYTYVWHLRFWNQSCKLTIEGVFLEIITVFWQIYIIKKFSQRCYMYSNVFCNHTQLCN